VTSEALYERDALAWAEQQAALLGRLARGERTNQAIDWPHVIEEVRDVGLSELRACQSLLVQSMAHVLKLAIWPDSASARQWRAEIVAFLGDARRAFTPSMRQRIDVEDLYADAARRVLAASDDSGTSPAALPDRCPFTLDGLLTGDVAALVAAALTASRMTGM
jgi:hypothetical protein